MKKQPSKNEIVEVIDNKTGKVIGEGKLKAYMPDYITIEQTFDSRTVHFKGYEPERPSTKDRK